ncbi:hypothetical protein BJV40_000809 [Clostridium beijerinckii]|nr:hypothetical protein [Clostridium beijerinckii]
MEINNLKKDINEYLENYFSKKEVLIELYMIHAAIV